MKKKYKAPCYDDLKNLECRSFGSAIPWFTWFQTRKVGKHRTPDTKHQASGIKHQAMNTRKNNPFKQLKEQSGNYTRVSNMIRDFQGTMIIVETRAMTVIETDVIHLSEQRFQSKHNEEKQVCLIADTNIIAE